jgi:hypothetical protein
MVHGALSRDWPGWPF